MADPMDIVDAKILFGQIGKQRLSLGFRLLFSFGQDKRDVKAVYRNWGLPPR